MIQHFITLALCAAATILSVRLLLVRGIDRLAAALNLSGKTRGQIIGYATSVPELVVVVSSALAGVFDAGFWNIASSNIINFILFSLAVASYRQHKDLLHPGFIDESIFCVLSIAVPLLMFRMKVPVSVPAGAGLLALFFIYKILDRVFNRPAGTDEPAEGTPGNAGQGLLLIAAGIAVIIIAGRFLGASAGALITTLGIPAVLVGWLLGLITSIPEMTSFFEIYRLEKTKGRIHLLDDTQQALDALVASNMSNLGLILPLGIIAYSLGR